MKKLFLLDAYALIYRAYYAMMHTPRMTSTGLNTSAIFGFCNTLDDILRKENPSHIAVCFDPPGPTFRHEAYAEYKADREAQPEDITRAIPYIKRIIEAYNIPVIEVPGYEADDVIGTLAKRAAKEGYDTYMMTPDKDYGQLVGEHIWQYRPPLRGEGFEIRGPKEVCERYGVQNTLQIIDLLAIEGDKSDNIPGCPGIGKVGAQKLIAQWGSVENMLAHADEIAGAIGRKVRDNAEAIRFSKMLATIHTDVPVECSIDSLVRTAENVDALIAVYRELEFRSFIKRLTAGKDATAASNATPAAATPAAEGTMGSLFDFDGNPAEGAAISSAEALPGTTLATLAHDFAVAGTLDEVAEIVKAASTAEAVGVELHAVGQEAMTADLVGLAVVFEDGRGRYIPLPAAAEHRRRVLSVIEPLFGGSATTIVSHEVKRSMLLLRREGIDWTTGWFDVAVAHYLLESEASHRLSNIAARHLNHTTTDYGDNPRKPRRESAMTPDAAADLFCEEALVCLRLRPVLLPKIESQGLGPLLRDVELPLIKVLASMEYAGVRVDTERLAELSQEYTARLHALEQQAYEMAGHTFNVGSPGQVGELLFGEMKIDPKAKRTKTGSYSTTEEILEKYRGTVPLVDLILEIRGLKKLLATYIDALPALINPSTGRIHTTYNQLVTSTGRISSTNPNLQNIPIRTEEGRKIRACFIADPGCKIVSADYSQIELRLIADISQDAQMVEAFLAGGDIHRATAAKIYNVAPDDVTDTQRRNAKTANFGIIYGISAFGLSERLGIPRSEAKDLIEGYFATYPHIRDYITSIVDKARAQGYVSTVKGRRRYLPDITSRNAVVRNYAERNAVNAPIQGSAADIIKIAMVNIDRRMAKEGVRSQMLMQVHDELVFNVIPEEIDIMQRIVKEEMEGAYRGAVPLEVSAGVGDNWLEAH